MMGIHARTRAVEQAASQHGAVEAQIHSVEQPRHKLALDLCGG